MPRRTASPGVVLVCVLGLTCAGEPRSTVAAETPSNRPRATRPNVILIVADDLGVAELGCYGQQKIRDPSDRPPGRRGATLYPVLCRVARLRSVAVHVDDRQAYWSCLCPG